MYIIVNIIHNIYKGKKYINDDLLFVSNIDLLHNFRIRLIM